MARPAQDGADGCKAASPWIVPLTRGKDAYRVLFRLNPDGYMDRAAWPRWPRWGELRPPMTVHFPMETINPPAERGQRPRHCGMDFTLQGEGVEAYRWTAHLAAESPKAPLTVEACQRP
jgi:hypothetical protein